MGNIHKGDKKDPKESESDVQSGDEQMLSIPWRKPPLWSKEERVEKYNPPPDLGISEARILLIDPIGDEKCSFVNTIRFIFQNEPTDHDVIPPNDVSTNTKYRLHRVKNRQSKFMNFCLYDAYATEKTEYPDVTDFNDFLEGKISQEHDIIGLEKNISWSEPQLNQKIHCVVFVFGASNIKETPLTTWDKVNQLQEKLDTLDIPRVLLVTKINKISKDVANDVTKVFVTKEIQEVVSIATHYLHLARGNAMPIQDYDNNNDPNENSSILTLHALDRILGYANDFLIRHQDIVENKCPKDQIMV